MGTITVVLPDDLIERLRAYLRRGGARKGDLSRFVASAIEKALMEAQKAERTFVALKDGREVARAGSLAELAEELRARGINPGGVRVRMVPPPSKLARAGARAFERR